MESDVKMRIGNIKIRNISYDGMRNCVSIYQTGDNEDFARIRKIGAGRGSDAPRKNGVCLHLD